MKGEQNILIGISIGALFAVVILAVFFLGVSLGRRGDRFFPFLNFERQHMHQDFFPRNFGHGAMGAIESLGENTLVVRDRTGAIKTVLVDSQTQIKRGHININFSDLKENEQIIVLGEPEEKEGAMKAKFIRVMG